MAYIIFMKIATLVNLIVLNNNEILLIKRSENEDSHKGKWSIPGGGIELNETKEETLKREINEELNCKIKWFKFFKKFEYKMPHILVKATYYYGEIKGNIKLSKEHSEFKWFNFNQINDLNIAFNQKEILEEFIKFYT